MLRRRFKDNNGGAAVGDDMVEAFQGYKRKTSVEHYLTTNVNHDANQSNVGNNKQYYIVANADLEKKEGKDEEHESN
ncbi:hypothetical protein L1887_28616 [Cichorium endivia]|nr:hypothetical protein L1887_28616 [Cichorium endivia]